MTTYAQGSTATLSVLWREYPPDGPLVDVNNIQITIQSLAGGSPVLGPTALGVTHPATGTYVYEWAISALQDPGSYLVLWTANDVATTGALEATEIITVASAGAPGLGAGVCEIWDPILTCELPTGSEAVSGTAMEIATQVLHAMSARQFGLCEMTIRPCRRDCWGGSWPFGSGYWYQWSGGDRWPYPALIGGLWYNLACGGCGDNCSCSIVHEVALPGPIYDITQVKVDGVPLTPGTDYRLDNSRLLVRLGGEAWPLCNDLNLADTEEGTWSVTFRTGRPVPTLGRTAAGVLGVEFAKMLLCDDDCALPLNVTQLSRQGVDITLLDPQEIFENRRTGLYLPDLFINTYNPNGRQMRARVYDIDAPYPRRTGT